MCNCFLFCAELNRYFTQKIEHAKYVFRRERERKKNWQYLIVLYANEWVNNNLFNVIIHPERSLMFFVQHFTFRFLECVSLKKWDAILCFSSQKCFSVHDLKKEKCTHCQLCRSEVECHLFLPPWLCRFEPDTMCVYVYIECEILNILMTSKLSKQ